MVMSSLLHQRFWFYWSRMGPGTGMYSSFPSDCSGLTTKGIDTAFLNKRTHPWEELDSQWGACIIEAVQVRNLFYTLGLCGEVISVVQTHRIMSDLGN